ncbi:MAG: hypothetical protein AB7F22_07890 [Reyranella sp.]|uniref:hypothetical protein n=1 Tax=Reyranella sp. TaxID=1929291 RepID=UPI003D147BF0
MPGLYQTSFAAQSLGLSPGMSGGGGIGEFLRDQLAEQSQRRQRKSSRSIGGSVGPQGAAALDLFGGNPMDVRGTLFGR